MSFVVVLAAIVVVLLAYVVVVSRSSARTSEASWSASAIQGDGEPGLRRHRAVHRPHGAVDMREQVVDVPPQEVITSDNVVVSVDAVVYYEATDPHASSTTSSTSIIAITKLAQTNLRNVIGDMQLDKALTSRDKINTKLREILDDATDKWGIRVVRVEIQRIDPPPDVMSSHARADGAERTRRALVTEAKGDREAAITRAEGEKQAAILGGRGRKQAAVLGPG